MPALNVITPESLVSTLTEAGFEFVRADQTQAMLDRIGSLQDWTEFASSWSDLVIDTYLAAQGHHRRRRHAAYSIDSDSIVTRLAHQPHYQSRTYNPLQGGIERWFEPVSSLVGQSRSLHTILQFGAKLFNTLTSNKASWYVEVHQFRIEANRNEPGLPTPEGVHRDGVDYVMVFLVKRENISSGTTTIHAIDNVLLDSFTLRDPLDAALLDDNRVFHGVTMVHALDPQMPAWRDVLVVTFNRARASIAR